MRQMGGEERAGEKEQREKGKKRGYGKKEDGKDWN